MKFAVSLYTSPHRAKSSCGLADYFYGVATAYVGVQYNHVRVFPNLLASALSYSSPSGAKFPMKAPSQGLQTRESGVELVVSFRCLTEYPTNRVFNARRVSCMVKSAEGLGYYHGLELATWQADLVSDKFRCHFAARCGGLVEGQKQVLSRDASDSTDHVNRCRNKVSSFQDVAVGAAAIQLKFHHIIARVPILKSGSPLRSISPGPSTPPSPPYNKHPSSFFLHSPLSFCYNLSNLP